jgi:protein TonB
VLLPENVTSHPEEIQRAVLAHELLHVKRRDWIWVIGEEVLRSVLWFHPGIWWLVGRVRLAREEVVDELTVCVTGRRRTYLEALLAFADAAPFMPSAAFARRRHLFRRMTLISKEAVMSSRRIAVSCAVLLCGVLAGSWYAVEAFPLAQTPGVVPPPQSSAAGAGPLERNAKALTPDNPIPRRTYSVMPLYPRGASGSVVVVLRLTINTLGRVGELRPQSELSGNVNIKDGRILAERMVTGTAMPSDVFVKAGLDAVRQWVYDPPAEGPVSFDVAFFFEPGADTRLISYGAPLAGQPETAQTPAGVVPPPPPPPSWTRDGVTIGTPVRIGGDVKPPTKVKDVRPMYSAEAMAAHVEGIVILEAVVGPDGRVDRLSVLRSIPLLDQSAIDALKEWEFTPTLLNGVPVPVIMTVTVNFTLQ